MRVAAIRATQNRSTGVVVPWDAGGGSGQRAALPALFFSTQLEAQKADVICRPKP